MSPYRESAEKPTPQEFPKSSRGRAFLDHLRRVVISTMAKGMKDYTGNWKCAICGNPVRQGAKTREEFHRQYIPTGRSPFEWRWICHKKECAPTLNVIAPHSSLPLLRKTMSSYHKTISATLGGAPVVLEVLRSSKDHETGFMHRPRPSASNHGLLFVYGAPRMLGFWMKNVSFDIDLIALDSASRVFQIETLKAGDERIVNIRFPCAKAIELPAGFCAANGIGKGSQFTV